MLWLAALLLLLYPCPLWDPPPPPAPPASAQGVRPPPGPASPPRLELRAPAQVDRQAFLSSFERQAGAALMPCLRQALGESGSVTFVARLPRNGHLTGVRLVQSAKTGMDCAVNAVRDMDFSLVARGLTDESVEIGWRFDW